MELEQKETETMAFARLRAKAEAAATALPPTLAPARPPAAKKPCVCLCIECIECSARWLATGGAWW